MSNATAATTVTAASTLAAGEVLAQTATLGPKTTGAPGPGPYSGGMPDFRTLSTGGLENYETFGCKVYKADPPTPDWQTATVWFDRKIASHTMTMPDGKILDFWVFQDERIGSKSRAVPSPLMRVQQGDLVHVRLKSAKGAHTIHHHGIEPTPFNDGVGHVSFEVGDEYIYQWQANTCGTWIYHCHVNTPLHFEMGLYGAIIVDPKPDASGRIAVFEGGPLYDVEQMWVFDDIDPRWHLLEHGDGLCGEDVGLNIFEPKYFLVTGTPSRAGVANAKGRITARPGQKILIRMINASYSQMRVALGGLDATIVSVDGHALNQPWNAPQPVGPTREVKDFRLATATRYEVIIDLGSPENRALATKGRSFRAEFEFFDWVTGRRHNAGDPVYEGYAFSNIDIV
ncbi:multicopper oxidase domain-containing protein [Alsobacter sp. R-9]